MAKAPDKPADPAPPAAPAAPTQKRPTPEQLATIHQGGSYVFNPATGALTQTRKPAQEGK